MKLKRNAHTIDSIFILTVFLLFTVLISIVLAYGARIYKNLSDKADKRYNEITSVSYISNKIRTYNETGGIYISEFDGMQALELRQTIDNEDYITLIYYYNGMIMELSCKKDEEFSAGDGMEILAVSGLSFELLRSGLLKIIINNEKSTNELFVYLNCV